MERLLSQISWTRVQFPPPPHIPVKLAQLFATQRDVARSHHDRALCLRQWRVETDLKKAQEKNFLRFFCEIS